MDLSQKLLLVEGKDEVNFFEQLLHDLDIANVNIIDVGGKTKENFTRELKTVMKNKAHFFRHASHIALVRDADSLTQDSEENISAKNAAFQSIQNLVKELQIAQSMKVNSWVKQKSGIKLGIFIIANNNGQGMLEDLCLELVGQKPMMKCVNSFITCVKSFCKPQSESKNKALNYLVAERMIGKDIEIQSYLSGSFEKPVNSIGLAAKKNYWWTKESLNDNKNLPEAFNQLKSFLQEFAR